MLTSPRLHHTLAALAASAVLGGCGSATAPPDAAPMMSAPTTATFEVTLLNLTAGQPLSPMVAIAHSDTFSLFTVGEPASVALEHLAEGGESAPLAALANDSKSVFTAAVASGGLAPVADSKTTVTLTVPLDNLPVLRLSMAAMLGNTNDGFAGLAGQSIGTLAIGASSSVRLNAYDAGTELNTESADTVPGPATAGTNGKREAFNAMRDDVINAVHVHPGIVSKDDGLPTSALTQQQRWNNSVALLTIKRTR